MMATVPTRFREEARPMTGSTGTPRHPRAVIDAVFAAALASTVDAPLTVTFPVCSRPVGAGEGSHRVPGHVEAVYTQGLLVRARAGWRLFVSFVDLYVGDACVPEGPVAAAVQVAQAALRTGTPSDGPPDPALRRLVRLGGASNGL
jgi:hypothetical protein